MAVSSQPLFFQKRFQQFGKFAVALGVGVDLVGFQILIAEDFRPRAAQQGDSVLLGYFLVERVVAEIAEQRASGEMRDGHQYGRNIGSLHGLDDFADVGTGGAFGQFSQEVVAADADDDELKLLPHQPGQAGKGVGGGVAGYAAVDDFPAGEPGQLHGIGSGGSSTVAIGEGIAQGEHGAAFGEGLGAVAAFAAGGQGEDGAADEELSSVHGWVGFR